MPHKATREQIVAAADQLFYQQGYEYTSFADIAAAVSISRGNFYYHFKSKDDILEAVIQLRLSNTQAMLELWASQGQTAQERVRCFIQLLIRNRAKIALYGCPVGTLCGELAKLEHPALNDANQLFRLFRHWLRQQFESMGHRAQADALAMHLLARSQGIATLAQAFQDQTFIEQEAEQLDIWLTQLGTH